MTLKVDNIQNESSSEANVVLNSDGSISIPSQIKHVGDDNTLIEFETDTVKLQTAGTTRATVDSSGNVGIGTTSPSTKLEVQGDNQQIRCQVSSSKGVSLYGGSSSNTPAITYDGTLRFFDNGSGAGERLRIDSSGRLLVGTTSAPTGSSTTYAKLVLRGNTINSNEAYFALGRGSAAVSGQSLGSLWFIDNADGQFARIDAHCDGTPGASDFPGRLSFWTTADGASSPTERMRITSSGTVLVGRTTNTSVTSSAALQPSNLAVEVASDTTGSWWNRTDSNAAWVAQRFYAQGSLSGFIQVNTSSVTYSTSSDYRLKENIVPLTGAVNRLNQLQVRRFNFTADPDTTVDGFIAHEAQEVVPECVTGTKDEVDDEGNPVYQGIDQSKLVPLLTAALQEAIERIETLETEVAALKAA